jgi:hypothetical protein
VMVYWYMWVWGCGFQLVPVGSVGMGLCVCVCGLILAGFVSVGVWVWWCVGVRGLNRLTGRSIHGSVVVSVVVVGGVRQSVSWVAGGWVSSLSVIGWTCR